MSEEKNKTFNESIATVKEGGVTLRNLSTSRTIELNFHHEDANQAIFLDYSEFENLIAVINRVKS